MADSQIAHKLPDLGYPFCTEKEMLYRNDRCPLLLNCFILFLWCIRWIRGASESIYKPLMGRIAPFLLRPTLKLSNKIPDLGHPLITDNGAIYCWNRHPLQLKYFMSYLLLYTEGGMSLWQHLWAPYSSHGTIFVKVNSQIACKLPDLVCHISTGNGMLYYNERHSLLMKWSIPFL